MAATALAKGAPVREETRRAVLDGLTFLARTRALVEFVQKRAGAGDALRALVCLNAADRVGEIARNRQVEARVRRAAAWALGRLGRAKDLREMAQDESIDSAVRDAAKKAPRKMGYPGWDDR